MILTVDADSTILEVRWLMLKEGKFHICSDMKLSLKKGIALWLSSAVVLKIWSTLSNFLIFHKKMAYEEDTLA